MDSKEIEQVTGSMAAVSLEEAKVIIICADGKEIYLDRATTLESMYVLRRFNIVKYYPDYDRVKNNYTPFKLKLERDDLVVNIPSDLVEKAFRYCYNFAHLQLQHRPDDLEAFDAQFFMDVDYWELLKLNRAAYRFDMKCLMSGSLRALDKMTGLRLAILHHYLDLYKLPF